MPHVTPLPRSDPEFAAYFDTVEQAMGFVPNSLPTMARRPEILRGFATLASAVLGPGTVELDLKQLVALMASSAAGCSYCQAHTSATARRRGASVEAIHAIYDLDGENSLTPPERAALRFARAAAIVPNAVDASHFAALREHFREEQIVEILAVISLFGWLNRWNDSMGTELEPEPLAFAQTHLSAHGWTAGKHGGAHE